MRLFIIAIVFFIVTPVFALTEAQIKDAYYKSYTYEKMQDYENAINALSSVLNEYQDGYTVNLRMGWLYYLKTNYANSISHYQTAIKAAPSSIEAKLGYLNPLLAQGKYEKAETFIYQTLSIDCYNYYANLKLAYALRKQKKYDLAEKVAKQMLILYPIDVSFLTELGLTQHEKGETDNALVTFWNILVLDNENPVAKQFLTSSP